MEVEQMVQGRKIKALDGHVWESKHQIAYGGHAWTYPPKSVLVGQSFRKFLATCSKKLALKGEQTSEVLGVSSGSIYSYEKSASDRIRMGTMLAICVRTQMRTVDLEVPDRSCHARVDKLLLQMGFKPKRKDSLKSLLKDEWQKLVKSAGSRTIGLPGDDEGDNNGILSGQIQQLIVTSAIPRGKDIDLNSLVNRFDQRPTAIKVALDTLSMRGVVDKLKGKGNEYRYRVSHVTPNSAKEVMRVRIAIEQVMLREAAENSRLRKLVMKRMQTALDAMDTAHKKDEVGDFTNHDVEFHMSLTDKKIVVPDILYHLLGVITTAVPLMKRSKRFRVQILKEHTELLELVSQGKESLAEAEIHLEKHIMGAGRRLFDFE